MSGAFSALTGWALFGGLVLAVGAVVARWAILPRGMTGEDRSLSVAASRAADVGMAGAALVTLGMGFYLARQLLEFHDPFTPWLDDLELLLARTPWGRTWSFAAVGSMVLLVAFGVARSGRTSGWSLATVICLPLGAFPGMTGHAAGVETLGTLTLFADATHVWAAGGWIGGLAAVLYIDSRSRRDPGGGGVLARLVPRFSPVAMICVGTLTLTGVFATWSHLPGVGSLFTTGYGRMLLLKLLIVGVVLAMGARNFRSLSANLGTEDGDRAMQRSATLELAVAQLVLVATALLVRMSPLDH